MEIIKKILGGIGTLIILVGTFELWEKIVNALHLNAKRKWDTALAIALLVFMLVCVACASRYI